MTGRKQLIIEPGWCKGCGICVEFCPKSVLELVNEKIHAKDKDSCILCGMCEMHCPDYAIYLKNAEE